MQFTMSFLDIDCSLSNPTIALAVAANALLFCIVMARVLLSSRSPFAKALWVCALFVGAFVGSELAQAFTLWGLSVAYSDGNQSTSVGCVTHSAAIVGPGAAVLGAFVVWGAWQLMRRARLSRAP